MREGDTNTSENKARGAIERAELDATEIHERDVSGACLYIGAMQIFVPFAREDARQ